MEKRFGFQSASIQQNAYFKGSTAEEGQCPTNIRKRVRTCKKLSQVWCNSLYVSSTHNIVHVITGANSHSTPFTVSWTNFLLRFMVGKTVQKPCEMLG